MHQRIYKSNSSNPSRQEKSSQFFRRSGIVQTKQNSYAPPTQEEIENDAFDQNKFEAVDLQIKQTNGTITPIEQERLGVLQAKMDDLLAKRVERAERFGHHLVNIPLHSPDRPVSAPVQPKLPFGLSKVSDTQQSEQKSSETPWNREMSLVQRIPTAQRHLRSPIQAKLTIGQPDDKYEQEADRVAQKVMQQLNAPKVESTQSEQWVQRESLPEEDELRMKPMAMRFHDGPIDASADLEEGISRARGSGQPLDAGLQQSMGHAFGADFSGVRVHTDAQSDQLNRSIQARAFTTGQDLFFRQGAYQPGSRGGQELIAHELTHVVQQNNTAINRKRVEEKERNEREKLEIAETSFIQKTVIQRVLLDDGTDLDSYILNNDFEGLENLLRNANQKGDDFEKIEDAMNQLKGNLPNSLKYKGNNQEKDDNYDIHEWSHNLPKKEFKEATVKGKWYRFWNDDESCLDFEKPCNKGMRAATSLNVIQDVNIEDAGFVKNTKKKQSIKQKKGYNYWHFWAANEEANLSKHKGCSPPGYTWHHHKDVGKMQLIDRDVHAAFAHRGGKSIWGT